MIIGIDPGKDTGLAAWIPEEHRFQTVATYTIIQAMNYCRLAKRDQIKFEIWFEDARLRGGKAEHGRLQGVGSVKRDCSIWEEFCENKNIPYRAIKPVKGATKWNAELFKRVTGWEGRTSEHARDAGCLVYEAKRTRINP